MNIDRVRIKGLFDNFDHDLKFGTGERIMLVIGPNGFGKTTTLNLIDILFNHALSSLVYVPFREVDVSFDDGTRLITERLPESNPPRGDEPPLRLTYHQGGKSEPFTPLRASVEGKDVRVPLSAIEDFIPVLNQVGPREWINMETGATLDLADVYDAYWDYFPPEFRPERSSTPDWLEKIRRSVKVRFINTERLTRVSPQDWRHRRSVKSIRTVSHYSKELAQLIEDSIAEYGTLSQELDRTFPNRLVDKHQRSNGSAESLNEDLDNIDQRRLELQKAGLLKGEQHGFQIPDLEHVDEAQRHVLAVYAQDARKKLAVFDDLYEKVNTFTKIANSRFLHKQVTVSSEGLSVTRNGDTTLDLEKLSSGEQHELVMLYELLFRTSSNSLILVDEPEISLHVAWQKKWVSDLERVAKLSNFRAIAATHSPEIIGDRWHLTVALHGRDDA